MQIIPFDDIGALQAQISTDYGAWSDEVQITQSMITAFADLTGDRQWIHVDVDRASVESPFGSTIAHGFLTLSMATILKATNRFSVTGHGSVLNYGIDGLRFISPVPSGAFIHGRTRLEQANPEKGGTALTLGVAIHVVGQGKPALVFSWKLLYRP